MGTFGNSSSESVLILVPVKRQYVASHAMLHKWSDYYFGVYVTVSTWFGSGYQISRSRESVCVSIFKPSGFVVFQTSYFYAERRESLLMKISSPEIWLELCWQHIRVPAGTFCQFVFIWKWWESFIFSVRGAQLEAGTYLLLYKLNFKFRANIK